MAVGVYCITSINSRLDSSYLHGKELKSDLQTNSVYAIKALKALRHSMLLCWSDCKEINTESSASYCFENYIPTVTWPGYARGLRE